MGSFTAPGFLHVRSFFYQSACLQKTITRFRIADWPHCPHAIKEWPTQIDHESSILSLNSSNYTKLRKQRNLVNISLSTTEFFNYCISVQELQQQSKSGKDRRPSIGRWQLLFNSISKSVYATVRTLCNLNFRFCNLMLHFSTFFHLGLHKIYKTLQDD